MNKQQLEHLSRRLNEKIKDAREKHPNSKVIEALSKEKSELNGDKGLLSIVGKATKTELQSCFSSLLLSESYVHRTGVENALRELPAAVSVNNRIEKLDTEIVILKRERTADIAKLEKKRDAVYDQAVFADSPEEVMKAIEKFLAG